MNKLVTVLVLAIGLLTVSFTRYEEEKETKVFSSNGYLVTYIKEYHVYIPEEYTAYLLYMSEKNSVPIWLIARVIEKESSWRDDVVNANSNGSYDYGIMQLNSSYLDYYSWKFNDYKVIDYFNPYESIKIGVKYLRFLYEVTGDWKSAVASYNCGLTKVRNNNIPKSTQRYVEDVFTYSLKAIDKGDTNEFTINF
jgi:soluble lytic murein transglycosylase-like protein